jgi:hypothetical protein
MTSPELPASADSRDLAAFDYSQGRDRTLGSFSSFAAGFSYISILTGIFHLGFGAGCLALVARSGTRSPGGYQQAGSFAEFEDAPVALVRRARFA